MTISVPILLVGDSVGVKEGGILSQSLTQVEISCYPTDVPEQIELNIEGLELNSGLNVGDLDTGSEEVEVISDVNLNIVSISSPTSDDKEDESLSGEDESVDTKENLDQQTDDSNDKSDSNGIG